MSDYSGRMDTISRFLSLGIHPANILIPRKEVDLERWAVIACDQFTSDRSYWDQVEQTVADAPSTLRMIIPEAYLGDEAYSTAVAAIKRTMKEYIDREIFRVVENSILHVRRTLSSGTVRNGIVMSVDLDRYDFRDGSTSIVRASEATIPERLPPRIAIRDGAAVECPHVLVLYDDPDASVVSAITKSEPGREAIYRTELMLDGGSVEAFPISAADPEIEPVIGAFEGLVSGDQYGFVFATGDGNHSLAAAKTVWEEKKRGGAPPDDPLRYCLVELVNVHDPGLPFHPIHRIAKTDERELLDELLHRSNARFHGLGRSGVIDHIQRHGLSGNEIGFFGPVQAGILSIASDVLPVSLVDDAIAGVGATGVDYTHGLDETMRAAETNDAIAVFLPEIDRASLFPTIARDGALPRKAFSLGEARDKRYYLECRALTSAL
jgi:uncharacterized protein (DUF1015 family)